MQTNVIKNICPNCGAVDCQEIKNYQLLDIDLDIEFSCPKCHKTWVNTYGLYYLGYSDENGIFDRDGLRIRY